MGRAHLTGLAGRLAALGAVLFLVALLGLGALGVAVVELQSTAASASHSDLVVAQSNSVERLIIDLETGVRGYLLTEQRPFLEPTRRAERLLPAELAELRELVGSNPQQERRATALTAAVVAYRLSWVAPTLRDPPAGLKALRTNTRVGKREVDAMRLRFTDLVASEDRLHAERTARVRFVEEIVGGLVIAVVLTLVAASLLNARWLRRRVVVPLIELQQSFKRFGAESYEVRASESGFAEVGHLARSFNSMADELAESRREAERLAVELEQQARTDGLTGLANRRCFDEQLERACASARRYGAPVSLLTLDLDDFKSINDTLGHAAGDEALKAVATACLSNTRNSDIVARIGGDEFAILLPNTSRNGANSVAAHIQHALGDRRDDAASRIRVSAGTASATAGADAEQLLADADTEMYAHKRDRRSAREPASARH